MSITITNTFGRPHPVSETNPVHVTGAPGYRVSMTATLLAEHPRFADCVDFLRFKDRDLHTRPEGYGLILLESEEHAATYFGPVEQAREYERELRDDPAAVFDQSQGFFVEQWPHGKGWEELLPPVYWNMAQAGAVADGVGLVTAFAHNAVPGAEVIVYEYEGRWGRDSDVVKMVTYHCTGCHGDTRFNGGHVHANTGPYDRRWAARQAREHITGAVRHGVGDENSPCRPGSRNEMLRTVNAVAKDMYGHSTDPLPSTEDAYCAVKGPCSVIRELRAGVRPPAYY